MKKLRIEVAAWLALMASFVVVCGLVYVYRSTVLGQFHAQSFDTLLEEARDYGRSGDSARAEDVFATLLSRYSDNEELLVAYGEFLEARGRLDEAESIYAEAASLGRQRFSAARRYAGFLERNGRSDEAVAFLTDYVTQHPDDLTAQLDLGFILLRLERWEAAIKTLQKAAERPALELIARRNLAGAYAQSGQTENAIQEWQRIVAMGPEPEMQLHLQDIASAYESLDRFESACETWQAFLDQFPNSMLGAQHLVDLAGQYGNQTLRERAALRLEALAPEIRIGRTLTPELAVVGISTPNGASEPGGVVTIEVWFQITKTIRESTMVDFLLHNPGGQIRDLTSEPETVGRSPFWRGETVRQLFAIVLPKDLGKGTFAIHVRRNADDAKSVMLWEFTPGEGFIRPDGTDPLEEATE